MPEGHSIHRLAALHNRPFAGHPVGADSPQGRFAHGAARLTGLPLGHAEAHGTHLLHSYGHGEVCGCTSTSTRTAGSTGPPPQPAATVRLRLLGNGHWADLRGPVGVRC